LIIVKKREPLRCLNADSMISRKGKKRGVNLYSGVLKKETRLVLERRGLPFHYNMKGTKSISVNFCKLVVSWYKADSFIFSVE
jgi:hypothetical protein